MAIFNPFSRKHSPQADDTYVISVTDEEQNVSFDSEYFPNEVRNIYCLYHGMLEIYSYIYTLEKITIKSGGSNVGINLEKDYKFPAGTNSLLPNWHHWFAINAVNFVRMIGWCRGVKDGEFNKPPYSLSDSKKVKRYCRDYIYSNKEIQSILTWRNKVSAHPSLTDPRADDDYSSILQFSQYPIRVINGRIFMSSPEIDIDDKVLRSIAFALSPKDGDWSLSQSFARICSRYKVTIPVSRRFGKVYMKGISFPISVRLPGHPIDNPEGATITITDFGFGKN